MREAQERSRLNVAMVSVATPSVATASVAKGRLNVATGRVTTRVGARDRSRVGGKNLASKLARIRS